MKDDEYMCWRHNTIRDLDLYENNCEQHCFCSTITWVNDMPKKKEVNS